MLNFTVIDVGTSDTARQKHCLKDLTLLLQDIEDNASRIFGTPCTVTGARVIGE